jgi:hypothetical protein
MFGGQFTVCYTVNQYAYQVDCTYCEWFLILVNVRWTVYSVCNTTNQNEITDCACCDWYCIIINVGSRKGTFLLDSTWISLSMWKGIKADDYTGCKSIWQELDPNLSFLVVIWSPPNVRKIAIKAYHQRTVLQCERSVGCITYKVISHASKQIDS